MTGVSSARTVRGAQDILRDAAMLTLPGLRRAVEELPGGIRHLVGVHFGWWDEDGVTLAGSAGKAVRPALVLLSCEALGGRRQVALPAAVAVELVHNASLLHDDIIDGDRLRRGRPALWASLGAPAAILAGDALFFLATEVIAGAPSPLGGAAGVRHLTAAVQMLVEGEYADALLEHQDAVSIAEYAAMAAGKTGALIAASCAMGALAAGAHEERVGHLHQFGAHAGAAFQIIDDCLGIWGDPAQTGKPRSDLRSRKKTLPVAAALASEGVAGRRLRTVLSRPGPLTAQDADAAAALIEEAGGRQWARREADRHVQRALERLHAAGPAKSAEAELTAVTELITSRSY
ncbi:polyprenyl synthetase family protein [Streptomyces sp. NPDC050698]